MSRASTAEGSEGLTGAKHLPAGFSPLHPKLSMLLPVWHSSMTPVPCLRVFYQQHELSKPSVRTCMCAATLCRWAAPVRFPVGMQRSCTHRSPKLDTSCYSWG